MASAYFPLTDVLCEAEFAVNRPKRIWNRLLVLQVSVWHQIFALFSIRFSFFHLFWTSKVAEVTNAGSKMRQGHTIGESSFVMPLHPCVTASPAFAVFGAGDEEAAACIHASAIKGELRTWSDIMLGKEVAKVELCGWETRSGGGCGRAMELISLGLVPTWAQRTMIWGSDKIMNRFFFQCIWWIGWKILHAWDFSLCSLSWSIE